MMGTDGGLEDSLTVGLMLGFNEQTCVSNNEKPVVQLPVMSLFPLQCASTSMYSNALIKSSMSSPRGICFSRWTE